jgi:hypothetical protein
MANGEHATGYIMLVMGIVIGIEFIEVPNGKEDAGLLQLIQPRDCSGNDDATAGKSLAQIVV